MSSYNNQFMNLKMKNTTYDASSKKYISEKQLTVDTLHNAIIIPDSIKGESGINLNGVVDERSLLHVNWQKRSYNNCSKLNVTYRNEEVVYIGMFHFVWGHCITDNLKHLWFLFDEKYKKIQKLKFVYIVLKDNNKGENKKSVLPQNFLWILRNLGIADNQLEEIIVPTTFFRIYLPEQCFYYDNKVKQRFFTSNYIDIINRIERDIYPAKYKKIYFSRTGLNDRKDFGENKIESLFQIEGYKIIYPEKLSISEQIALLKGCEYFACTEGSISHNVIFCRERTNIIIIRKFNGLNGYQLALNSIRNYSITYIDANKTIPANSRHPYLGPFFLYKSPQIIQFFCLKQEHFPYLDYVKYLLYVLKVKSIRIFRIIFRKCVL